MNSGEGRGWRRRNSRSGVTRRMAKGADVHAGQSSSPTAAARRNASAMRMRSSGASATAEADDVATVGEGMAGADDACGVVQAARRVRPMAVEVKRDMAEKWRV